MENQTNKKKLIITICSCVLAVILIAVVVLVAVLTKSKPTPTPTPTPAPEPAPEPIYTRINAAGQEDESGEYILFGSYAKTIKASNVTVNSTPDAKGYYLGSDGAKYVKVTATLCTENSTYGDNGQYTYSDGTAVTESEAYFKVERIKWKIMSEENGSVFILSEDILTNHVFDASTNNYKDSDIRAWLNDTFLNTAFSAEQQALIQTTEVDNSEATTCWTPNEYACENTNDKIFLMSHQDAKNTTYFANDSARCKKTTDYAKATGAYTDTESGMGRYWLRSPAETGSTGAEEVRWIGNCIEHNVNSSYVGVAPALIITLE